MGGIKSVCPKCGTECILFPGKTNRCPRCGQTLVPEGHKGGAAGRPPGSVTDRARRGGDHWDGIIEPPVRGKQEVAENPSTYNRPEPILESFNEETKYVIAGVCPGYDKDDFVVALEGGHLVMRASDWEKRFTIPVGVDFSQLVVTLKNGVLLVEIPKREGDS